MVWEVVTPSVRPSDPKDDSMQRRETQAEDTEMTDASGGQEHFPSSPSMPTSDSYMEYDDLPDLQEVTEGAESDSAPVYQVEVGVSHQERQAHSPDTRWLTQLAHIATGPQSPLLQEAPRSSPSTFCIQSTSRDLHSYARPPPSPPPPPPPQPPPLPPSSRSQSAARGHSGQRRRSRRISLCSSALSTRSSLSDDEDMGWSVSCPPTAWHCFLEGTRVRFHHGPNVKWRDVEELESADEDSDEEDRSTSLKGYGSEGLKLVEHAEIVLSGQTVLQLTFHPGAFGGTPVTARCQLDHPFYIKSKGWSSFHPSLTVVHYGIPCYEMEVGDVCLPPGHRDAKHTGDSPVFDTFRSYAFTPLDSSAVYVLSSMARRRRASQSSGGAVSPDRDTPQDAHSPGRSHATHHKPTKGVAQEGLGATAATKCKRPMNAFMLFAKKFRVEYTQMYPGKDNRAISVLLGERWKKMRSEERRAFTLQAKALADEQKRLNPDCWKRKRTNSGCQGN